MNCSEARRALTELDDPLVGDLSRPLAEHVRGCPDCGLLRDELSRTWRLMGEVPEVEPSADFAGRVLSLASGGRTAASPLALRRPAWQWMALAACILMLCVPFALRIGGGGPPATGQRAEVSEAPGTDAWDNAFLQQLQESLDRADRGYLSEYDSWSRDSGEGTAVERPEPAAPAAVPKLQQDGGQRHDGA